MLSFAKRTVLVLGLGLVSLPVFGSDLPLPNVDTPTVRQSLERNAALYLIRAAFNVISSDDIPTLLVDDAKRLATAGPNPQPDSEVSEALTAEGSYYITSLTYLISAGGANWPTDHPEAYYDDQTLPKLAAIQHQWLADVSSGADLRPLLLAIDQINAETEGYTELPASLDHFGNLDQLVDSALTAIGAKSPT